MERTPYGTLYKEIFKNLLKDAGYKNSQVECLDKKTNLWKISSKEGDLLFYGYDLGLNKSSIETTCRDKYLTWTLLNENKKTADYSLPLEMKFFNAYNRKKLTFRKPLSLKIYELIEDKKTVLLMNEKETYKVSAKSQVDNALQSLGLKDYFLSTNFVPSSHEYQVIFGRFEGKTELLLCLKKEPLKIKGDGERTINQLVLEKLVSLREGVNLEEIWKDINTQLSIFKLRLSDVLPKDKEVNVTWRLNKDIGAEITVLDKDRVPTEVLDMAKNSFQTLGMNFGGIDIAECEANNGENKYLIMGSNTQVLTDLLDYCEYESLVEITKKAIEERAKFFSTAEETSSTRFIEIKEDKDKENDINISTYKDRTKIRKECIKEVSKNLQLSTKFYSQDYLAVINDDIFMVDFDMGINNSSAVSVCGDKGITSKILNLVGISCVEHRSFDLSENNENDDKGIMEKILEKFKEWDRSVVIKKNKGRKGLGIYRVKSEIDLERIILKEIKDGITLSPYLDIDNEYRVIILHGAGLCIYKKNRIYVKGDGKSSLSQLITSQIKDNDLRDNIMADLVEDKETDLSQIIGNNENYLASWKHNLNFGSTPEISKNYELNKNLLDMAKDSVKELGIKFGAVDIIETREGKLQVLEVNSFPGFYHFIKVYGKDNFNLLLEKLISEATNTKIKKEQPIGKLETKIEQSLPFKPDKK